VVCDHCSRYRAPELDDATISDVLRSGRIVTLLAVGLALEASAARADLPPPPDYVEQCTVVRQQADDELCKRCGGPWHGDSQKCHRLFEATAFTKRCKTLGASVWDEVWCRPLTAGELAQRPAPAPVSVPARSGCSGSSCSVGWHPRRFGSAAIGASILALGLLRWRRRR